MAGLFLSHSSKDKIFVQRLAIDLVNAGVPVWFDVWRLEPGDLLSNEIYSAVDASSLLLLVLSPDSVNSDWVEREIEAALAKEGRLGRKVLIPIKLREVELPAKLADRIFLDFSVAYTQAFERLVAICEAHGILEVQIPPEKQIVPITFTKGIFLKDRQLERRVRSILQCATTSFRFDGRQLLLERDDVYLRLQHRLFSRIDALPSDPFYSPDIERALYSTYQGLQQLEKWLLQGLVNILNDVPLRTGARTASLGVASHWFARLFRKQIYALLYDCQRPDLPSEVPWQSKWQSGPLDTRKAAADFFECDSVAEISIGLLGQREPLGFSDSVQAYIPRDCALWRDLEYIRGIPFSLLASVEPDILERFLIPQLINEGVRHRQGQSLLDLDRYWVGIA